MKKRLVQLEGAYNVRDIGGYATTGGKKVTTGFLFRADELSSLTDSDLAKLNELNIKTYVDFRAKDEAGKAQDRKPASLENHHYLYIDPASVLGLRQFSFSMEDPAEFMREINVKLAEKAISQYSEFFRIVEASENAPLLFHCTAGKDRTGFAAALILSALGVPRETVYHDYMLSAELIEPKFREEVEQNPNMGPLSTVELSYIEAAFGYIDDNYGGVDKYLTEALNVNIGLLRELYTVD